MIQKPSSRRRINDPDGTETPPLGSMIQTAFVGAGPCATLKGMEREITEPVDLCLPNGRLNPAAVGWTRTPLHTTNLKGWGRAKRWEYWNIQTPDWTLGITVSNIDYLALHQVYFADFATGEQIDATVIAPLARQPRLAPFSGAPARARTKKLQIDLIPTTTGVRLIAHTDRVDADFTITRPDGHESMAVVIPWSDKRFQYTVKDNTLPATGTLSVDGKPREVRDAWAVLDHGRGKWPYSNVWNWGSGSGTADGHTLGLQFGGKWTVGTGCTENAICVDGRITKLHDELEWTYDGWMDPWTVRGDDVDLTFTPRFERASKTNVGVIFTETHQCFGVWDGTALGLDVSAVRGFAEEAVMRW